MFKVVKVFLKNSPELQGQEIYCVRLDYNEDFEDLKTKIFTRCPQLKNQDPQIYWFDLENDKIRITCDDDLKFFMEESPCHKIIFNFGPQSEAESSRKRANSSAEDVDNAKRIRKQLQQIDLSSESSAMETDDDDAFSVSSSSIEDVNESAPDVADKTVAEETASPAASSLDQEAQGSSNVQVLSVEIIKPADLTIEIADDLAANPEVHVIADDPVHDESATVDENLQQSNDSPRKKPQSNRIVISDSSDEETDPEETYNRRNSDGPSATAYAFSSANGNRFEHSSNYCGREQNQSHRFFPRGRRDNNAFHHSFERQRREFQRRHSENMDIINENVRMVRNHAARAVRASTAAIPDLVNSFRSHFRYPAFRMSDNLFHGYDGR